MDRLEAVVCTFSSTIIEYHIMKSLHFPTFVLRFSHCRYTGWWFQPLWKKIVSWDYYSQNLEIKMFQITNQYNSVYCFSMFLPIPPPSTGPPSPPPRFGAAVPSRWCRGPRSGWSKPSRGLPGGRSPPGRRRRRRRTFRRPDDGKVHGKVQLPMAHPFFWGARANCLKNLRTEMHLSRSQSQDT
jgi:hypothetical protein